MAKAQRKVGKARTQKVQKEDHYYAGEGFIDFEPEKLYVQADDIEFLDTRSPTKPFNGGVVKLRSGDQVKFRKGELVVVL